MATTLNLSDLQNCKASPSCSNCGSPEVLCEAFVLWNERLQKWTVSDLLEGNSVCNSCGQHCEIKWRVKT